MYIYMIYRKISLETYMHEYTYVLSAACIFIYIYIYEYSCIHGQMCSTVNLDKRRLWGDLRAAFQNLKGPTGKLGRDFL